MDEPGCLAALEAEGALLRGGVRDAEAVSIRSSSSAPLSRRRGSVSRSTGAEELRPRMFGGQREENEKTVYATADASTYLRTASQAVDVLLSDFLVTLVFVDKGARFGFRNVLPLVIIFLDEPSCNSVEDKDESELVFRHGLCMDREVSRTSLGDRHNGYRRTPACRPHVGGVSDPTIHGERLVKCSSRSLVVR